MKHSKEPWKIDTVQPLAIIVDNEDGVQVCGEFGDDGFVETRANAEHIVNCVNNCEGINPEAVPDLLKVCKSVAKLQSTVVWVEDIITSVKKAIQKAEE